MNVGGALIRMKNNPGLKMCMPMHYRSWQYNYYDKDKDMYCIENGEEWNINLSLAYEEFNGYEDYNEDKR
jgi:hypothetical protein